MLLVRDLFQGRSRCPRLNITLGHFLTMLCRTLSPGTGPTRFVRIWSGFFASVNLVPRDLLFVRNWFGFWSVLVFSVSL